MIKKGWGAILQEKYLQSHEEINRIIDVEHLYDNEHKYKYNLVTLWHSLEHIHNIDDYFKDQSSQDYKNLKGLDCYINGVGIMDGGIADNQGIGSMMKIFEMLQ